MMAATTTAMRCGSRASAATAFGLLMVSIATAQEPVLRAEAAAPQWIAGFAAALEVPLPSPTAGQHIELLVDAEGTARARPVPAPANAAAGRLLRLELRPAAWLALAKLPADAAPRSERNRAVAFGQLLGLTPRRSGALADALWARLHELDHCELTVTAGSDTQPARLELLATPRADSELARWLPHLRPALHPAPTWPWPRALLQVRVQLDPTELHAAAAPLLPWWSAITGEPVERLPERLASHDGRLAFVIDDAQWGLVIGLRDVEAFAARWREGVDRPDDGDAKATRHTAAPYRDIALLRTRQRGRQALPRYADAEGVVEAFGGIVGAQWLQVAGQEARSGAERAIDDALAGRLSGPRTGDAPEPAPNCWLTLDLDVKGVLAVIGDASRQAPVQRATLRCATSRTANGTFQLRLDAEWR